MQGEKKIHTKKQKIKRLRGTFGSLTAHLHHTETCCKYRNTVVQNKMEMFTCIFCISFIFHHLCCQLVCHLTYALSVCVSLKLWCKATICSTGEKIWALCFAQLL